MISDNYTDVLYVRPSTIAGLGLFTSKEIKPKSIIAIPKNGLFTNDYDSIKEKQTAIRYCMNYYQYGSDVTPEDFLNHSVEPNCIYHCGILFAIKDINAGDELTIDYGIILPENSSDEITTPLSNDQAMISSLEILLNLFKGTNK